MTTGQWKCFLCAKKNNESEKIACVCCKRPRSYAPKSYIDTSKAKPLALHGLASSEHPFRIEQIEMLVSDGLDLGAQDTLGWTALHCAARVGQDRVVAAILEKDSSKTLLEAATPGGWCALHHAVACGHLAVVEELLGSDAEVDARVDEGERLAPLHLAAMHGHAQIMDLLLECGANPKLVTEGLQRTVLHLAVASCHVDCVKLLLTKTDLVRERDAEGMSPLQQAHLLESKSSQEKEQLIKLLEMHQHPLERAPLLNSFLKSTVA